MTKNKCPVCSGTGVCQICQGEFIKCKCKNSGKCTYCSGTGENPRQ